MPQLGFNHPSGNTKIMIKKYLVLSIFALSLVLSSCSKDDSGDNPAVTQDSDGDGINDTEDAFPNDPNEPPPVDAPAPPVDVPAPPAVPPTQPSEVDWNEVNIRYRGLVVVVEDLGGIPWQSLFLNTLESSDDGWSAFPANASDPAPSIAGLQVDSVSTVADGFFAISNSEAETVKFGPEASDEIGREPLKTGVRIDFQAPLWLRIDNLDDRVVLDQISFFYLLDPFPSHQPMEWISVDDANCVRDKEGVVCALIYGDFSTLALGEAPLGLGIRFSDPINVGVFHGESFPLKVERVDLNF